MKKQAKIMLIIMLILGLLVPYSTLIFKGEADLSVFTDNSKICYSQGYKKLSKKHKNGKQSWRHGMVSGNGLVGYVTSGAPDSDTYIFQNMHFILPNQNGRDCPDTSSELETVKQSIVDGKDIVDNASYDNLYAFHPGGQLRIEQKTGITKNYIRYTDYETSQTGVKFDASKGTWQRNAFTSMVDNASVVKYAASSDGEKLNLTLSYDDISTLANFGDGNEKELKYKKYVNDSANAISFVAHYPNFDESELKNGGYATLVYVITDGETQKVELKKNKKESQYVGSSNDGIKISNAQNVYLIAISDRDTDMCGYDEFNSMTEFKLVNSLYERAQKIADKYKTENGFDYDAALNAHLAVYKPQFDAVTLELKDSTQSNEGLLAAQRGRKELNAALLQRLYYSGRYAYLCCSGYSTSRLAGMWTGEWAPGWDSKYTMDANVNLQTSSMNSGNFDRAYVGYTYMLLRQLPDWEINAKNTHGFDDAIQAPVHSDGDNGTMRETCYAYPFRYWNAGAAWMIQPLFETVESYGNVQIPLSDEFDLEKLRSVLSPTAEDLTDEQIQAIRDKGYLDLEKEILYPMLIKSTNYWKQMLSAEYYTTSDGQISYEKGKTQLADNEYYCILPSYSPENNPENYPSPSVANCAIDVAACRDNIRMLLKVMDDVASDTGYNLWMLSSGTENVDLNTVKADLNYILTKLPPYLYDETGALKEFGTTEFTENNTHRHLSHLYCVWPLDETQKDENLKKACIQAIDNRASENEASHALIHRGLIAARLKDSDAMTEALLGLVSNKINYDSLLTNHNFDRSSAYCTDFAIGYLGMINESLMYSNVGEIELLPCQMTSGFEQGKITGLRTRTRAVVTSLEWTQDGKVSATITSEVEQDIVISCRGNSAQTVHFGAGETKTVNY